MQYNIAIIVLQWNNAADTLECLASLQKIDYPSYEIIVVDNGSTDGAAERVSKAFPDTLLLPLPRNIGFAAGNNRGITLALARGADACLLLNNDTVVDTQILRAFQTVASADPKVGALGAKIFSYDAPTTLWYAGGRVIAGHCIHEKCGKEETLSPQIVQPTEYACGCALFVTRPVIEKIGLMDPRFFLMWEEIDWCWRMRRGGYSVLFVPAAQVWHKISRSFPGGQGGVMRRYFYTRSRLLFLERNYPKSFLINALWESFRASAPSPRAARDYLLRRFCNITI